MHNRRLPLLPRPCDRPSQVRSMEIFLGKGLRPMRRRLDPLADDRLRRLDHAPATAGLPRARPLFARPRILARAPRERAVEWGRCCWGDQERGHTGQQLPTMTTWKQTAPRCRTGGGREVETRTTHKAYRRWGGRRRGRFLGFDPLAARETKGIKPEQVTREEMERDGTIQPPRAMRGRSSGLGFHSSPIKPNQPQGLKKVTRVAAH